MDYITHTLFGAALYGAVNKQNMNRAAKWSLLASSVGSSVIPDIDIHWAKSSAHYLMLHRGITHSLLMVPVWAAMFSLVSYLVLRTKDRRIFYTAVVGVLLHIISDWSNPWATGLLEPFTLRKYAIGIIPNKGYVLWPIAAVIGILLLIFRNSHQRLKLFRMFWVITALYVCFQIAHSAYVYVDLKAQGYERIAFRADRMPGGMSYYAKKENVMVEGRSELGGDSGVIRSYISDPVDLAKLAQNPQAKELLLFAPFVATQDLGGSIRIFDPRFAGRIGLLEVVIPTPK